MGGWWELRSDRYRPGLGCGDGVLAGRSCRGIMGFMLRLIVVLMLFSGCSLLSLDKSGPDDGGNPGLEMAITLHISEVPIIVGFSANERIWKNGVLLCLGGIAAGVLWLIVRARRSGLVLRPPAKST